MIGRSAPLATSQSDKYWVAVNRGGAGGSAMQTDTRRVVSHSTSRKRQARFSRNQIQSEKADFRNEILVRRWTPPALIVTETAPPSPTPRSAWPRRSATRWQDGQDVGHPVRSSVSRDKSLGRTGPNRPHCGYSSGGRGFPKSDIPRTNDASYCSPDKTIQRVLSSFSSKIRNVRKGYAADKGKWDMALSLSV
jgi:hypothetical protein